MNNSWLTNLMRKGIKDLEAYSYPRNEVAYREGTQIWLDYNEAPYAPFSFELSNCYNIYPETQSEQLAKRLATLYNVAPEQVLTTRGADEAIELLIETFATPYESAICITNPTFGSYVSFANLNGIKVIDVPLCKDSYLPDWKKLKTIDANIFFFCSPSNPIGNIIPITDIKAFAKSKSQKSLIIVDEAYIEFSDATSCISLLNDCENVIILRTLSKAYALAGLRIGITISSKEIINALRIILAPHPVPIPSIQIAIKALGTLGMSYYKDKIQLIKEQRDYLTKVFEKAKFVKHVYPSQTNFILVAVDDPDWVYSTLKQNNIIIKRKDKEVPNAVRFTIGTPEINQLVLKALGLIKSVDSIRKANISRITKETEIYCETVFDGVGRAKIQTGLGFFDHMLDQIAKHSSVSLTVYAKGDLHVDNHHLIEDTGILLGQCLKKALGNKKGIARYANSTLVMDEAKAEIAIDICDRAYTTFAVNFPQDKVGEFPSDMVKHFFDSIAKSLGATINIQATGENTHHIIEIIFKCFAKVLKESTKIVSDQLPSTKGAL